MMNNEFEKIIAVDYDGTIDFAGFPRVGSIDKRAVEKLKQWQKKGVALILWTCRTGTQLQDAVEECKKHGLIFDAVNENIPSVQAAGFTSPKVVADYYIDDRAVGGLGDMEVVWDILEI